MQVTISFDTAVNSDLAAIRRVFEPVGHNDDAYRAGLQAARDAAKQAEPDPAVVGSIAPAEEQEQPKPKKRRGRKPKAEPVAAESASGVEVTPQEPPAATPTATFNAADVMLEYAKLFKTPQLQAKMQEAGFDRIDDSNQDTPEAQAFLGRLSVEILLRHKIDAGLGAKIQEKLGGKRISQLGDVEAQLAFLQEVG